MFQFCSLKKEKERKEREKNRGSAVTFSVKPPKRAGSKQDSLLLSCFDFPN